MEDQFLHDFPIALQKQNKKSQLFRELEIIRYKNYSMKRVNFPVWRDNVL